MKTKLITRLILAGVGLALNGTKAHAGTITLSAQPPSIVANGTSRSYIYVTVAADPGTTSVPVTLAMSGPGTLDTTSVIVPISTGSNMGTGLATLTSTTQPGTVTITGNSSGYTGGSIQVITTGPNVLSMSASPTSIRADGTTRSVITITANEGSYVSPVTVNISVSGPGTLSSNSAQIVIPSGSLMGSTQVSLTSTRTTGTVTVTGSASGFTGASTQVTTTKH